ncbi:phytosulfokines-like [Durio zibethinus]|uniref:Phytosulfokine n=1 Tax=Durio zibethinus TaxID=66656 RepID=A0A6P5XGF5_DURZI|nr:phytosulfokines-like [Durio zibethinus]
MCSKVSAFCMIVFLLFFTLSGAAAARPGPASALQYANTPIRTQHLDSEAEKVQVEDSCEGIEKEEEEEECLMRRTLAAHVDYIYTQKTKP